MVKQIVYTPKQIQKASYSDLKENSIVKPKTPINRHETPHGRTYHQRDVDIDKRTYIYSSTTILNNVLDKGIGFKMWLGNAKSYNDAMEYANERALIGTITHVLCEHIIWGKTIDCRDGFLLED
jgi:hypothetical protein